MPEIFLQTTVEHQSCLSLKQPAPPLPHTALVTNHIPTRGIFKNDSLGRLRGNTALFSMNPSTLFLPLSLYLYHYQQMQMVKYKD